MSDHEDKKRPDQRVDPLLSLSIGNELRKEIERATEKIERSMEKSVDRLEKVMEKGVERIEKRLLRVEARTSYILGLLSVIGIAGGILTFLLRAGGG